VSTKILNETYTQGLTGFCQHQGNTAALTDQPNSLSPHSSFLSLVMLPTNFPAPPSFLPLPASSHLLPRGLRQSTVSFPEHKGKGQGAHAGSTRREAIREERKCLSGMRI